MTSTERRRTLSERLDPRNWSLVAKLAVVGLVPTVLALAIGAFQVVDQANIAEELGQGSGLVEAHQQVGTLTRALQAERAAAVTFVSGNRLGDRNAVDSAQAATDQAVARADQTLAAAEQQAPQIATARRQADTTLGQLPVIRSQVTAPPTPAVDVTTRYTAVVQRTLALDRALLGQLQTSDTAGLAGALGSTAAAGEALELERTVLGGAIAASQLDEQQKALVNGAEASYQSAASDFQAALTPQQVDRFGNFATDPVNAARQNLRDAIMATPENGRVTADAAAWNAAMDASTAVVRAADDQAEQQFVDGRAQAAEQAGNTAGLNSVLLMLGLILTVGIILLLGRQLVRSLRVLRTAALDVAERRLPQAVQGMRAGQAPSALVEPVPLESRDEIGEVARAFDAVHGQAIRLAADQAALQQNVNSMFVNLSRRSQALVERQLQLIEQLESNEQDPDQLSNLFQLDHLATRMRRNSENLLVLAGTDLAKRNVAPVQVVDVLRAAVSEVEQYQRVVVQTPPTATIAGRAANDVVHLLAELLDNATNFSPPDSQVVMSTTRTADESLLIEIADRGVGMGDSELSDANQRLSGPSEVDVSASRRMGLFVVGRLAARHRVGVRLSSASGAGRTGGLSASVTVPPQLVPSAAQVTEQPPAMVGAADRAVRTAPPLALDAPEPVNSLARNGSAPSTIRGSDGPVAPTFGSGSAATPSSNGSSSKLPTRTPGSALRRNPTPGDPGPSTDGMGAAPNGYSPVGATAFAPSGPSTDRPSEPSGTAADVFTPASDSPASTGGYQPHPGANGSGPARDARWPEGGRFGPPGAGNAAGANGYHAPTDDAPDPVESPSTAHVDEDGHTAETVGDGWSGDIDAAEGTGSVAVSDTPDDTARTTEHSDDTAEASEIVPAPGSDGSRNRTGDGVDTTDGGVTTDVSDRDDTPEAGTPQDDGHGSDGVGRAALGAAAAGAGGVFAGLVGRRGAGQDAAPSSEDGGSGTEAVAEDADDRAVAEELQPGPTDTDDGGSDGAADAAPEGSRFSDDDRSDGHVAGTTEDAEADGVPADHASTPGTGTDVDEGDAESHGTAAAVATPGGDRAGDPDGRSGSTAAGTASGEQGTDGSSPGPDDADADTTAFPAVRPPREPMGGPRTGAGPARPGGPLRPAPARRPVMPRGPVSSSAAPGTGDRNPLPATGQTPANGGMPNRGTPNQDAPDRSRSERDPAGRTPATSSAAAGAPPAATPDRPQAAPDALFAPAVAVEGDRGQLRRPGGLETARSGSGYDISQTTPIFEEIASAWFRSNRSVPVRWQDDDRGAGPSAGNGGPSGAAQQASRTDTGRPDAPRPSPSPAPRPPETATAPGTGSTRDSDAGFASPADAVWRQAAGGGAAEDRPDEMTSAGLPKRRPRARLLPGSAAGSTLLTEQSARNAENVRGRLASYQQGVRQGRESASGRTSLTGDGTPESGPDGPKPSDHEENT